MQSVKTKKSLITGIVLLGISVFLTIGVKLIFHACVHEDGSKGSCFWAEQAVQAAGILLILECLILVFAKERSAQRALSLVICGTGIVTALLPQVFISLCMMPSMRCNALMRPCTIACSAALVIGGILNLFLNRRTQTS